MDVIERAIRSAFEKGNAADKAFRERVYRQAFSALDKALQGNPGVTVETAMRRRKSLQAKIVQIEQEFQSGRQRPLDELSAPLPPLPTSDVPAVEPDRPAGSGAAQTEPVEMPPMDPASFEAAPAVAGEAEPNGTAAVPTEGYVSPQLDRPDDGAPSVEIPRVEAGFEADQRPSRSRLSKFASFFVAATLFSMLVLGLWWASQTGLLGSTDQPEPVATEPETEDFEPGADQPPVRPSQAAADREWIPVFGPGNVDAMSAPSDASATVMKDDDGAFVRIRSGKSGAAVLFDIGQGVLERIAGKTATFDIVARAEDGKDTQMSVLCNFAELGDCGRKRYDVGQGRADYLFDLAVPAKRPGAGGTIAINSDVDGEGKSVDIFEIRVSIEE